MNKKKTQRQRSLLMASLEELFHYRSPQKLIDYDEFYNMIDWDSLNLIDFDQLQFIDTDYMGNLVDKKFLTSWMKYLSVYVFAFAFLLVSVFSYVSLYNKITVFNNYLVERNQVAILEDIKKNDLAVYSPSLAYKQDSRYESDPVKVLNDDFVIEETVVSGKDAVELAYLELEQPAVLGAVKALQSEGVSDDASEIDIAIGESYDMENVVELARNVQETDDSVNFFKPTEAQAETSPAYCSFKVNNSHFSDGSYYYKNEQGNTYVCVNYSEDSYYSVWEVSDKDGKRTTMQSLNLLPDCMSIEDSGESVTVNVYNSDLEPASSCTLHFSGDSQVSGVNKF